MKVKIKGADLIRFYYDEWPGPDVAIEDAPFSEEDGALRWVDGVDDLDFHLAPPVDPDATYTVTYGRFWWQSQTHQQPPGFVDDVTLVLHRWLKAQKVTTLAVEVPREEVEAFRALCAERKWRVR